MCIFCDYTMSIKTCIDYCNHKCKIFPINCCSSNKYFSTSAAYNTDVLTINEALKLVGVEMGTCVPGKNFPDLFPSLSTTDRILFFCSVESKDAKVTA